MFIIKFDLLIMTHLFNSSLEINLHIINTDNPHSRCSINTVSERRKQLNPRHYLHLGLLQAISKLGRVPQNYNIHVAVDTTDSRTYTSLGVKLGDISSSAAMMSHR